MPDKTLDTKGLACPAADPEDQEGAVRAAEGRQARGAGHRPRLRARLHRLLRDRPAMCSSSTASRAASTASSSSIAPEPHRRIATNIRDPGATGAGRNAGSRITARERASRQSRSVRARAVSGMTVGSSSMAKMRYRVLGASGMKVSEICLGTMMFGGPTDAARGAAHHRPRRWTTASTSSTPPTSTPRGARRP